MALLDQLPIAAIDLNALSADRLQRFLDAFKVQIHYDGRTRRARLQAEIAAELVAQPAQIGRLGQPRWGIRPQVQTG